MIRKIIYLVFITILLSCSSENNMETSEEITEEINLPELKTDEVTDITLYTAKTGGKLIDSGDSEIIEIGIVVGTSILPTTDNNLNKFIITPNDLGDFSITITHIPANTTYYIRAYGINSEGIIGYGNEVQFTSPQENVYNGTITLATQEEVNNFGANNYTTVTGRMFIEGSVTSLEPLNNLVIIEGSLHINNTHNLENLIGLENLKVTGINRILGSSFEIRNNSSLISLNGLNGLIEIGAHHLTITNNDNLVNLDGLNNLRIINNSLEARIGDNNSMVSLHGLEKLEIISGDLILENFTKLNDLSALSNLYFVGKRIYIRNNISLENVNGLEAISTIESLDLVNNKNLTNLDGLSNISSALEGLNISYNEKLNDLSAFNNINSVRFFNIKYNISLTNLEGFSNLSSIGHDLNVSNNSNLTSLKGLENLKSTKLLTLISNPNLINLEGLEGLTSIKGSSYPITITSNSSLNSLKGLGNLIEVEGYIQIAANSSLNDFCALKNLFFHSGHNGDINFTNNLNNPTIDEIIDNCN
jgi:hypothetical protein